MDGRSAAVPGFQPSLHGLHFANAFPPGPTVRIWRLDPRWVGVGDAAAGLCGGMSWFVREAFEAGVEVPPDTTPPANGSPLFRRIVRRQVLSLDWLQIPFRFYVLSAWARGQPGRRALERDWLSITGDIDAGRLPMVGLIRHASWNPFGLTSDHQVLAYAYSEHDGTRRLRIYDPNHPDRDDVELVIDADGLRQSTGEPLLDVFDAG